jgi:uncharacterized protein DUF6791/ThiF family protein
MSPPLISLSPDLKQLEDEGYEIEIRSGHLILHNIPYVDACGQIRRGKLVSVLDLAGDRTAKPGTHVALFAGDHPCDSTGKSLRNLEHSTKKQTICDGVTVTRSFSCKPLGGAYDDYHHKMTTYVGLISTHAEKIDPQVSAQTFQVVENDDPDSPFVYIDNASGKAGITEDMRKLELSKVAIIGLGGTGSYILDFVAKTPVREAHLFDGDRFGQHNAFRSPGAATLNELRQRPYKVDYYHARYSVMHRGIVPHPIYIDASNVTELEGFDFVFVCMDGRPGKEPILRALEAYGIPFVDTGMGIECSDDGLRGILTVTTSTDDQRAHVWDKKRISISQGEVADEYATNIQIADLNALNAVLAVIRWKKHFGFYADLEKEFFTTFTIDGNATTNEDQI